MKRRDFLCCSAASLFGISASLIGAESQTPFCGVKNSRTVNSIRQPRWDRKHLRYLIAGRDSDLERDVWDQQFSTAFNSWSKITPLTFEQVGSGREYDIIITVSRRKREGFGRTGGVLAWAQLPPSRNFDGVLLSKFDLAENWVLPEFSNDGTVLLSVAAHEIGHLLGLDHSNDPDALMYPYINNALKPRQDDIRKIQKLYK